jgi:hypothetical protein
MAVAALPDGRRALSAACQPHLHFRTEIHALKRIVPPKATRRDNARRRRRVELVKRGASRRLQRSLSYRDRTEHAQDPLLTNRDMPDFASQYSGVVNYPRLERAF